MVNGCHNIALMSRLCFRPTNAPGYTIDTLSQSADSEKFKYISVYHLASGNCHKR